MKMFIAAFSIGALLLPLGAGAQNAVNSAPAESPNTPGVSTTAGVNLALHNRDTRYQLRNGDSFDLDFALSPEFNQTVVIQPDGYAAIKGIGTIHVEGETIPELTSHLKLAYAQILRDPILTVSLKDFEKPYYIAAGQVAKPGKYELRTSLTVTEAIAIAGGFNDRAKHSQVVLFRPAPGGGYETKVLNLKKLMAARDLREDTELQPGDTIFVPQSAFSKIRPFIPTSSLGAYYNPALY